MQQIEPLPLTLLNAWAALHGEYWLLWTLHWRAKGASQYGDHQLYQRLYEARLPEIDRMAEVIAAIGGAHLLSPAKAMAAALPFIENVEALDAADPQKALITVQTVMRALRDADKAAQGTPYAMPVNNALAGIADSHLEAVYLLQQRLNGRVTPLSGAPSPHQPYAQTEFVPPAGMLDMGEPDEEAASIFALRRNSRDQKQTKVPEIMQHFGSLLGLLPGAAGATGSVGRSVGMGVALGAAVHTVWGLSQKRKRKR